MLKKRPIAAIILLGLLAGFIYLKPFRRLFPSIFIEELFPLFLYFIAGLLLSAAVAIFLKSLLKAQSTTWSPQLKVVSRMGFVVFGIFLGWVLMGISGAEIFVKAGKLLVELIPPVVIWIAMLIGYGWVKDVLTKKIIYYLLFVSQAGIIYYYYTISPSHLRLYLIVGFLGLLAGYWSKVSVITSRFLSLWERYWSGKELRTKKIIYYVFSSILVSIVVVFVVQTNIGGFSQEKLWYDLLTRVRGLRVIEDSPVTIIDLADGWPGNERFFQLLSILDKYRPRVIGINTDELVLDLDSVNLKSLEQAINNSRVVLTSTRSWEYTKNIPAGARIEGSKGFYVSSPQMPISYTYHTVQGRHSASRQMPMTYTPLEEKWGDLESQGLRLPDFGMKVIMTYLGRDTIEISDKVLREDGTILINHYVPDFVPRDPSEIFKFFVYMIDRENRGWFWTRGDLGDESYFRVDFQKNHFARGVFDTRGWRDTATVTNIAEVKDRIVLINIPIYGNPRPYSQPSQSFSVVYGTIIQNFLAHDFISEPRRAHYLWVSLLLLLVLSLSFFKLNPWKALLIDLSSMLVISVVAFLLFNQYSFFIYPVAFIAVLILSPIFYFPYEISSERQKILKEKTRLAAELRAAHDMQMGLMPTSDPKVSGFDISGICKPAEEVGGDYFDYVWLDKKKTKLGIAIVDVSGKAMKAAMTAVMTSGMVYGEIGSNDSPRNILQKINKPMYLKTDPRIFTAMSFAVIDTKTKALRFSNAGQMQPILRRGTAIDFIKIGGPRLPLGIQEKMLYGEVTVKLRTGDMVIFYTDGLPETMNDKNELYGFERLEQRIKALSVLSAHEILDRILEDVEAFSGSTKQHDDLTVVVVTVL